MLLPVEPRLASSGTGELPLVPVSSSNKPSNYRLVVAPLVNGKSSAVHKSFTTKAEAFLCFQEALLKGTVELIN